MDVKKQLQHLSDFVVQEIIIPLRNLPLRAKALLIALLVLLLTFYIWVYRPPADFPVDMILTIEGGQTLSEIADTFEEREVVRSGLWLRNFVFLFGGERRVVAGDYIFNKEVGVMNIAMRITTGSFGLEPIRITVPEGATSFEIAVILDDQLSAFNYFDQEKFLTHAENKEGVLFPDTYFFLPNVKEREIVKVMEDNFSEKIEEVRDAIRDSDHTLDEIIIMASLLEKEARTMETRRMISGILWNRLEIGMPLQVDAVFGYIKKTATFNPTFDDLEIDSPYNTYQHAGLPPGPIANPGLSSIRAALDPIESDFYYYLSDRNGETHYSETFERHKLNRRLYLN